MQINANTFSSSSMVVDSLCSLASTLQDEARTQSPSLRDSEDLQATERQLNIAVLQINRQMQQLASKKKKFHDLNQIQTVLRTKLEVLYESLSHKLEKIEGKIESNQQTLELEKRQWIATKRITQTHLQEELVSPETDPAIDLHQMLFQEKKKELTAAQMKLESSRLKTSNALQQTLKEINRASRSLDKLTFKHDLSLRRTKYTIEATRLKIQALYHKRALYHLKSDEGYSFLHTKYCRTSFEAEASTTVAASATSINTGFAAAGSKRKETASETLSSPSPFKRQVLEPKVLPSATQKAELMLADPILAANLGDMNAIHTLATSHLKGIGAPQSFEHTFDYHRRGAIQGYPKSLLNLGWCYLDGIGAVQDLNLTFAYHKMAADLGDADAQFAVADWYHNGIGVEVNQERALEYCKLAADQGHAEARVKLDGLISC